MLFVILISSLLVCPKTLQKRGVIQKEIRIALDIWQEKLDRDIYLIPIKFDDCEIPEKLKKFQWLELFDDTDENWKRLFNAIKAGWKRQGFVTDTELKAIDNLLLIENNFLHLEFELDQDTRNFLRIAKEAHMALYRSMIEALRGSANLDVTGKNSDADRVFRYKFGNASWMEIRKQAVTGCSKAWRYSEPIECDEPQLEINNSNKVEFSNYLIDFFDALAKVQDDAFMRHYVYSKPVKITDNEMKILEILNQYKGEYDYFVPKHFLAHKLDISRFVKTCIRIIKELLFDSKTVMFLFIPEDLETLIETVSNKI